MFLGTKLNYLQWERISTTFEATVMFISSLGDP